jgi:DNA-binding MarR family transcriptional regulator
MARTDPRRQQILNILEETGTLNVTELADRFGVSLVTIRKDLDDLGAEGLLERTFGGAVFSHRSRFNISFLQRAQERRQEKLAIAATALEYIKDGDTIILDAGTTTLALAQLLKEQVNLSSSSRAPSQRHSSFLAEDTTFSCWAGWSETKAWPYLGVKRLESSSAIGRTRPFWGVRDSAPKWVTAHPILMMRRLKRRLSGSRTRPTFW